MLYQVLALSFSPDGKWLASASRDGFSLVWSVKLDTPGSISLKLGPKLHIGREVDSIAWSPDSRHLLVVGISSQVHFAMVQQVCVFRFCHCG